MGRLSWQSLARISDSQAKGENRNSSGVKSKHDQSSYTEGSKIFELQKEQSELVMPLSQSVYLPGMRIFPTKGNINNKVRNALRSIINKRLKAMEAEEYIHDDFLGILLQSNSEEIKANKNMKFGMSVDEIIEECKLFYLDGQETTSTLLVWTMILLSQHTDWQECAR
ncbi:hypothetical protein AgCh_028261 [Apium graveolens]